jgi:hypothetical protein
MVAASFRSCSHVAPFGTTRSEGEAVLVGSMNSFHTLASRPFTLSQAITLGYRSRTTREATPGPNRSPNCT